MKMYCVFPYSFLNMPGIQYQMSIVFQSQPDFIEFNTLS
jgi:hypothetical protein